MSHTTYWYLFGFVCGVLSMIAIILLAPGLRSALPTTLLAVAAIGGAWWLALRDGDDEGVTTAR